MAVNLGSRYSETISELFREAAAPRKTSKWMPITYTSMFGWYLLNYVLLFLLMSLPIIIILWAMGIIQ